MSDIKTYDIEKNANLKKHIANLIKKHEQQRFDNEYCTVVSCKNDKNKLFDIFWYHSSPDVINIQSLQVIKDIN